MAWSAEHCIKTLSERLLVHPVVHLGRQTAAIVHAPQISYRSRQHLEERDHPTHVVLVNMAVKKPRAFFAGEPYEQQSSPEGRGGC